MPTLEFDELPARLGLSPNHIEFGQFSGSCDFDDWGCVQVIRVDTISNGRPSSPMVLTPRSGAGEMGVFTHYLFVALASAIEQHYRHVIADLLPLAGDPYAEHRHIQREMI